MMRRTVLLCAIAVLGVGCASDQPAPTAVELRVPLFVAGGNGDFNLGTHLTGDEEVPPRDTRAQGEAIFRVSDDESSVDFRLIASNIDNVIMAHIHCGRFGENGPIIMWLYPGTGLTGTPVASGGGPQNGVLASGTFAVPPGAMCLAANVGRNMSLLEAMRAGLTYVNVHTNDGVAPINTGPGDFPGGEIRGQIDHGR
jgi:CHRD domain-containing protein